MTSVDDTARTDAPVRAKVPGAARANLTTVGDRLAVVFRVQGADRKGAIGEGASGTIAEAARLALANRVPLVGVIASSGVDMTEGVQALHAWGVAVRSVVDCSGVVPVVFVVDGPAVSGSALLVGIADVVVMTGGSYAFVSGPAAVETYTGMQVSVDELGGTAVHVARSGVAHLVADDLESAMGMVADVLALLPAHTDEAPPFIESDDPPVRECPELATVLPDTASGIYDVRDVVRSVADDGDFVELRAGWAPNLVTGLAVFGGHPVGIVANQPMALAGTLDIPSSQKGAAFVRLCDSFNLPIVTMVDTSGFFPGKDLEWKGIIRKGAQLVFAYAEATVPRICLILRKAYGGAYIVMDCKTLGNDLCFAWPSAEVAVMGAKGAVAILQRTLDDEARLAAELDYEAAFLNPYVAAERGYIDAVVDPWETRRVLCQAVDMLWSKRERVPPKLHSNTPL